MKRKNYRRPLLIEFDMGIKNGEPLQPLNPTDTYSFRELQKFEENFGAGGWFGYTDEHYGMHFNTALMYIKNFITKNFRAIQLYENCDGIEIHDAFKGKEDKIVINLPKVVWNLIAIGDIALFFHDLLKVRNGSLTAFKFVKRYRHLGNELMEITNVMYLYR